MSQPLCLHVLVVSASDLLKKDLFGLSDPYVKLTLKRSNRLTIAGKTTKTRKKTLNPTWNEYFVFDNISLAQDSLLLEVFDANRLTRDAFLGKLHFKLQQMPIEMRKIDIYRYGNTMSYPLKPKRVKSRVSGTLKLKFLYYNDPPPRGSPGMGAHSLAQLVPGATGVVRPSQQQASQSQSNHHNSSGASPSTRMSRQISAQSGDSWVVVDQEDTEPLPDGWEERQDANGRTFYVDHLHHRTQWNLPTRPASQENAQIDAERRRRLAHTLSRRNPAIESSINLSHSVSALSIPSDNRRSSGTPTPPRSVSQSRLPGSAPTSPSPSPSPIPPSPHPQQPSEDELPPGWERRIAANGRTFYINHNTRATQWEPPSYRPRPRPLSSAIPSPSSSSSTSGHRGSLSEQDLGPLPAGWELRILQDGRQFFIDHTTRSTQWEDPRVLKLQKQAAAVVPYSRDYKQKYESFRKSLMARKPTELPRVFEVPVRRNHLFEDSHRIIMGAKNRDHLKTRLWIKFEGEVGLDYGGVSREWFFLLSHEMFNPYYGLFEYAASDNYTLQVNPDSGFCNENHLDFFRFIGRILAMAIFHQRLIDAFFIRPFYKMLLSKKLTLLDMEAVDTEFYNSIKYILENDPEPLCLTFTASREFLGQVEEMELKANGGDIDVTERNRREYVELLMKWRFADRINKQMDAIKKGFNDIFPLRMLQIFDEREIEYLLCGLAEINVDDWRKNTIYSNGYTTSDDTIIWFWKAVEVFDSELRARLLQFVTGTSKVPMNGFGELQGSNGPQKFCIKKLGEPSSLPRAHTCFNRMDLPPYRSYHELKEKLRLAVENTEGFEGVD